jgi:hypothetical protein
MRSLKIRAVHVLWLTIGLEVSMAVFASVIAFQAHQKIGKVLALNEETRARVAVARTRIEDERSDQEYLRTEALRWTNFGFGELSVVDHYGRAAENALSAGAEALVALTMLSALTIYLERQQRAR